MRPVSILSSATAGARRVGPATAVLVAALLTLIACAGPAATLGAAPAEEPIAVVATEPEDGAVVDRPVRSLRVWFDRSPDVALSQLTLSGPAGELEVTGLHTMGEDDLMAQVVGRMPDGEYTAGWTVGSGEQAQQGSWTFEVRRGGGDSEAESEE